MKFVFFDCIIIRVTIDHNHIKLVKFSRRGGGVELPLLPSVLPYFDFKILFAIIFIIISDETVSVFFCKIHVRVAYLFFNMQLYTKCAVLNHFLQL